MGEALHRAEAVKMDRVTIKDIANRSGVSVTTVSLVLNGKENIIAKETKKRVIIIAN